MNGGRGSVALTAGAILLVVLGGCAPLRPTSAPPAAPTSTLPATRDATSAAPSEVPTMDAQFHLSSSAFTEGGEIPVAFTCDGANVSPPLAWTGAPAGTAVFALILNDPDAGGFVHWLVYDLDSAVSSLPQGVSTSTAGDAPSQGENSFGKVGYGGPCPPSGTHHYVLRLLALDQRIELRTGGVATADRIMAAATGHILGEAVLTGTYRRR